MRPGTIIRPRGATVGQHVQGMDRSGVWYNATVLKVALAFPPTPALKAAAAASPRTFSFSATPGWLSCAL